MANHRPLYMNAAKYDEDEALRQYVWQNYPEVVRPHHCLPSEEEILESLPEELREEYRRHAAECSAIVQRTEAQMRKRGIVGDVLYEFPEMRPELAKEFRIVIKELEARRFRSKYEANRDQILVRRCPLCNRIIKSPVARACLWCGCEQPMMEQVSTGSPSADQPSAGGPV